MKVEFLTDPKYFAKGDANLVTAPCPECGGLQRGWPEYATEPPMPSGLYAPMKCDKCGYEDGVVVPHPQFVEFSRALQLAQLKQLPPASDS